MQLYNTETIIQQQLNTTKTIYHIKYTTPIVYNSKQYTITFRTQPISYTIIISYIVTVKT